VARRMHDARSSGSAGVYLLDLTRAREGSLSEDEIEAER
jgi:hypothetical protein